MSTSHSTLLVYPRQQVVIKDETYHLSDSDLMLQFPVGCYPMKTTYDSFFTL